MSKYTVWIETEKGMDRVYTGLTFDLAQQVCIEEIARLDLVPEADCFGWFYDADFDIYHPRNEDTGEVDESKWIACHVYHQDFSFIHWLKG